MDFVTFRVLALVIGNVQSLTVKVSLKGWRGTKTNSMASVHERTIPTEGPPLVSEVSANFCG
jgi:hypothetical protein